MRAAATKPSSLGSTTTSHGDNRVQGRATYGTLPSHQGTGLLGKMHSTTAPAPGAGAKPNNAGNAKHAGNAENAENAENIWNAEPSARAPRARRSFSAHCSWTTFLRPTGAHGPSTFNCDTDTSP